MWDCGPDCLTGWVFKWYSIHDSAVAGHQGEVTPLSLSSRLFLAQMVRVCYSLWLQRFHVLLDLVAGHCKDTHLSRQPADADVQLLEDVRCTGTMELLACQETLVLWMVRYPAGGTCQLCCQLGQIKHCCFSVTCRPGDRKDKLLGSILMRAGEETFVCR